MVSSNYGYGVRRVLNLQFEQFVNAGWGVSGNSLSSSDHTTQDLSRSCSLRSAVGLRCRSLARLDRLFEVSEHPLHCGWLERSFCCINWQWSTVSSKFATGSNLAMPAQIHLPMLSPEILEDLLRNVWKMNIT